MRSYLRPLFRWIGPVMLIGLSLALWTAAAAAKSKVTFWFYGSAKDIEVLEKMIADFEKENPDIDVERVDVPYTANWEKWAVAAAGGATPDVSMANWGIFTVLGGEIQPLDELIKDSKVLKGQNFFPAMWDSQVYEGKRLALPFRANAQINLYNKAMFADAGLSGEPRTWAEFANYAARLTVKQGNAVQRWGYSFRNAQLNRTANNWAERNGWHSFNSDYTKAYYTDSSLRDPLSYLNDMVVRGVAAIPGMPNVGNFAREKVAMQSDGPWILSAVLASNPDLQVGAFVAPKGPSGQQPYANIGGENIVMFRGAKDKRAALRFMEYLAYTRNAEYNKATAAFFPVVRYAANDSYWIRSDVWRAVLENFDQGRVRPWVSGTPCGVRLVSADAYDKALDDIFRQRTAVQTALEAVQQVAEADLKQPELRSCLAKRT